MAAQPGMMPAAGMPANSESAETESDESQEGNVTPEEQALYHKFMENYYTVMYVNGTQPGPKGEPPLVDQVRAFFVDIPEPVDALANAAVTVVSFLSKSAEQAGKPIPGDVLMHAGTEIISDLAELAENGGHHEYTEDEMSGALTKGFMIYKDMNADSLNVDEIKSDYESLVAADKEGRLDEVLPGASEAAKRLPEPEIEEGETPVPQQPMTAQQGQVPPQGFRRA